MWKPIALCLALTVAACASTGANAPHDDHDHAAEATASAEVDAYPVDVCVISGEPLPEEGYVTATIGERELRFCCGSCAAAAESDPERAMADFVEALKDAQRDDYPLEVCVVSGESLGSMGEPIELVVDDTLVRVCCAGCTGPVRSNPAPFIAKLDAAR